MGRLYGNAQSNVSSGSRYKRMKPDWLKEYKPPEEPQPVQPTPQPKLSFLQRMIQPVKKYFAPTENVRARDVVREIATGPFSYVGSSKYMAKQAEYARQHPKEAATKVTREIVEPAAQSALSLYEIPGVVKRGGKTTQREYDILGIPALGKTKSHLSNFENVANDVIEGKRPLWHALGPPAMAVGGVLDVYAVGAVGRAGIKSILTKPVKNLTDNEAGSILKLLSKEGKTTPADKLALDKLVDIKVTTGIKGQAPKIGRKGVEVEVKRGVIPEVKPIAKAPLPEVVAPKATQGAGGVGGIAEKQAQIDKMKKEIFDMQHWNTPRGIEPKRTIGQSQRIAVNVRNNKIQTLQNEIDKISGGGVGGEVKVVAPKVTPKPIIPEPTPKGISKLGKDVEARAVEKKLTKGFEGTAEFEKVTFKEQATRATELVNKDIEKAKRIMAGQEAVPSNLRARSVATALEEYAIKNGDNELIKDLAKSPLASETSIHAQELTLGRAANPNSPVTKIKELSDVRLKAAGGEKKIKNIVSKEKETLKSLAKSETIKGSTQWSNLMESLRC